MRNLILTVLLLMTAIAGVAQSNQAFPQKVYYASDYGAWQVQGQTPNTYQFSPSSLCTIPQPAGGTFDAFNVNGPVYIQDAVTANSEVLTPHFVNINATLCNVALTTAHSHYSFALMSGTAGLQEALNTIAAQIPYPTQVILDRNWYTALSAIPGQSPSVVIATVQGEASAVLVDNTTAPETFYKWNGSAYAAVAPAGGSIPSTNLVLCGNNALGVARACSPGTDYTVTGAVTPAQFGSFGDAVQLLSACTTVASNVGVTCSGAAFVSNDIGKQIWFAGAGAAGVAKHTTIATVTGGTTITVASAPATSVSGTTAVYGHDDVAALQSCFDYSAVHGVPCVLNTATALGYLEGSAGLTISVIPVTFNGAMNVQGNSQTKLSIFCEFNGDCLSLPPGPVQGANLSNIRMVVDPSQPAARGIHLNATVGTTGSGGLFNSTLTNFQVDNPALECLWLDGGGGVGYTFNLPNQYISFNNFTCNGPNQMHPANLILATGQDAQIFFVNGAVNGVDPASNYPNPLISVKAKTIGMNDAPMAMWFGGFTYEVGTQGLFVDQSSSIHYDNGYVERVSTPLIVQNSSGITFNGNHLANSGTVTGVASFPIFANVSMRDNHIIVDGSHTVAALAVCGNNDNNVDFNGNVSPVTTTSGCTTVQVGPTTSTLTVAGGNSVFTNASGTPITTIAAPGVSPGKTLTVYAGGQISLASGGNISFGGFTSPLVLPAGTSATLQRFDTGPSWLITATTAAGNGAITAATLSNQTMQVEASAVVTTANAISPTTPMVLIEDSANTIQTINLPTGFTSGCFDMITTVPVPFGASGNMQNATTTTPGILYRVCYWPGLNKWTLYAGGGPLNSVIGSEESIASSSTPTFTPFTRESTTVVTSAITTFTLAAGLFPGQEKTLTFCENGTGGFTVAGPANLTGLGTVSTGANTCSSQHFDWNGVRTKWTADSQMVTNQ